MNQTITKKKSIVPLKDLRTHMGKYISRVGRGESFTVVRRSYPVFMLSPVDLEREEMWERVIDFTEIDKEGVSAKAVLRSLKKIHGQDR